MFTLDSVSMGRAVLRRAVASVLAVLLVVTSLVSSTGAAAALDSTTVSGWSTTAASGAVGYTFGVPITVSTGTTKVARTVQVQRKASTATAWTTLTTATTTATGTYTAGLPVSATGTWNYRLVVPATQTAAAYTSPTRTLTGITGTATTVSGWSTTAASGAVGYTFGVPITVSTGTTKVARTVQVQRKASTATTWTTLTTATTTATGTYTAALPVSATGTWNYRLIVPATQTAAAYTSPTRTITGVTGTATTVSGWSTNTASAAVGYTFSVPVTVSTGTTKVARTVQVQRKASTATTWTTLTTATTTATGTYTAALPVSATGTWNYRLIVPATQTAAAYTSPTRTITGVSLTITSISPTAGPLGGGTSVTLTGTGFTDATGVAFGGAAGTSMKVVSDTKITATTPAKAAGSVEVKVSLPYGSATKTAAYTYQAVPTITAISPAAGPLAGGTTVTVTGTNLTGTNKATFAGVAGTAVKVVSSTQVSVVTPARTTAGAVDIALTTPGGSITKTAAYTYQAAPTITSLIPTSGPLTGNTTVTITGTNLTGTSKVTFAGVAGTAVKVLSATQVSVVTPARTTAGAVDIALTTPGGSITKTAAYTYQAAPALTTISPTVGPLAGGTTVTVTGGNLAGTSKVTFAGVAGTAVKVVSATQVTVVTPTRTTAGAVDVVLTTPGGTIAKTAAYTYQAAPTITSLTPTSGPLAGGTTVTITGTNLTGTSKVTFAGTAGTSLKVVSATQVTVVAPARTTAGAVDIALTTPGGTITKTAYTYQATPTITALSPTVGPLTGGTTVTITGTNLTGTSKVTFAGVAGTALTVVSASQVTVVAPARTTAGTVDIALTTPGGTITKTAAYSYQAPAPTITAITPVIGPLVGGNRITITGTNLTGTSTIAFGGAPGTNINVISDTQVQVVVPSHAAGVVDVTVTTPSGSTASSGAYTYQEGACTKAVQHISGTIAANTTLSAECALVYVVDESISVAKGSTLTIEEGVILKFYQGSLTVNGALNINGTATNPVTLTSFRDDTAGGDTNGDGTQTKPAPND